MSACGSTNYILGRLGESIPVTKVVTHWVTFSAARMNDTFLVFHSYYLDEAARVGTTNASPRLATTSDIKSVIVCCDYGKKFSACDVFQRQIKNGMR